MPTRLQDGLSVSLLQWMRSADVSEVRTVIVRFVETETVSRVIHNLENAGLKDVEVLSNTSLRGRGDAGVISRVARCIGVSSVTEDYHSRNIQAD